MRSDPSTEKCARDRSWRSASYQCAEFEFEAQHPELDTKTHQVRSRYYVVGRKMYHLLAIAPIGEPFPNDADRWLKSFRLTTAGDR